MEPVLFYGVPHGCSFASIVAIEWLGRPYRLCRIDMLDKDKDPDYLRVNSLRQTPALLLEDGEVINESQAILQHIAARDLDRGLGFAQGSRDHDRLNHVLAYLHTSAHSAWGALFSVANKDSPAAAEARARAAAAYAHVDSLLGGREWLVGDGRTVADAYLCAIARWGQELGFFDLAHDYPRVQRHLQKLEADPAVVFAHAVEDGEAVTSEAFRGHVSVDALAGRLPAVRRPAA